MCNAGRNCVLERKGSAQMRGKLGARHSPSVQQMGSGGGRYPQAWIEADSTEPVNDESGAPTARRNATGANPEADDDSRPSLTRVEAAAADNVCLAIMRSRR